MTRAGTPAGPRRDDAILAGVECRGWVLLSVASILALGVFGPSAAGGVFVGGVLGLLNFRLMKLYFNRVLRRGRRPHWWMHVGYCAKFGVLALILAAAFRYLGPDPLGVIAGFSILVVAVIWAGLVSHGGAKEREVFHSLNKAGTQG
ncbi:MAG: ATP synthase subunit I [Nitrospinota bacterium]